MASAFSKTSVDKTVVLVNRVLSDSTIETENDALAIEEPLEIRLGYHENGKFEYKAISITMRTPGG